jgi:nicotinamidase-related amidase
VAESRTALLVMDVQTGIVDRFDTGVLLERLQQAISAAREHELLVIYVRVAFRRGYQEVSARNLGFSRIAGTGALIDEETEIDPSVVPQPDDVIVTKKRVGAFTGSDLEVVLRAQEVRSLVLSGISTSGVVLSTLRSAADMDYELTVLADCCADGDPEVHRVLLEKVFPRQATVLEVADWAAGLDG